jgi:putative hydrolase of the HAD superfamily
MSIKAIFFDVGNTLGAVDLASKTISPFPEAVHLLLAAQQLFHVQIGVITNIPSDWSRDDVENMLHAGGLLSYIDRRAIVTSADASASKPDTRIFSFAAHKIGVQASECLFVDDDAANVTGALQAGMSALQKR